MSNTLASKRIAPSTDKIVHLMGIRLHNLHRDHIAARVVLAVREQRSMLVANANAQMVVLAQTRPWLRNFLAGTDITFCDGAGVQLAGIVLGAGPIHRTTPPEWIGGVLSALGPEASIYWLGGTAEVVTQAAHLFESRYKVRTAGIQHGYFDTSPESPDASAVIEAINAAQPNILLVNMSMPLQEQWLADFGAQLPACVAITAGALVDHAAGRVRRPPRWVANLGLEWLVRLAMEPRRLWRRYILGLPVFGAYVLRYLILGGGVV